MLRTALLGLLGLLVGAVLVGCGSSEAAKPRSSPSSSPSAKAATYFTRTDTDAINKVAAAAQKAEATALARATTQRCDRLGKTKGYPAWRACWHRALTPVATTLTTLAGEFTSMSSREGFPAACAAELRKAGSSFSALAARVQPLVSGIDSEKRAAQVKAMNTYGSTLQGITTDFSAPLRPLTQACYSPSDLKSINASPSASPSPSG